jgi:hypothetical protein
MRDKILIHCFLLVDRLGLPEGGAILSLPEQLENPSVRSRRWIMDRREAVICLDSYSDELLGLALLMRARTLIDGIDEEIKQAHEHVRIAILEKQREGMLIARDILTDTDRRHGASASANDFELNAAVKRFILANEQANASLIPTGTFSEMKATIEREAVGETEAKETKVAGPASPAAVSETAAAS